MFTISKGRKYLDFLGGIAVNALGHAHPRLVKAHPARSRARDARFQLYFTIPIRDRWRGSSPGGRGWTAFFSRTAARKRSKSALKLARIVRAQ